MNFSGQPNFAIIFHKPSLLSVNIFGEVDKGCVEITVLLLAFLLELMSCEDHVNSVTSPMKATLTLRKKVVLKMM